MKTLTSTALAFAVFTSLGAQAQTDNQPAPESQVVVTAPVAPAHLPYGVDDVLKLSRAKVSDDVIVSFVENSGIPYSLRANDIVFLREQGVTDHVISVMLAQKRAANALANTAPPPSQPVQPPMVPSEYPQYPQQPAADYAEPASSSYVIPYPTAAYPYYSSYGYSYSYPYFYASFGYPYCGYGGYYGRYCGYPYYNHYGYGHYGYPYRGYYGHSGFTAIHAGVGVHSGFSGHVGVGGHSGFTAIGGGAHVGGFSHFSGGGGAHIGGGGGGHMMAGGGGHFGGGGGGHMGGGHR